MNVIAFMIYRLLLLTLVVAALSPPPVVARNVIVATARQRTTLFEGPGQSFDPVGDLTEGSEVQLLERNHTGTWVRVANSLTSDGWVLSGHLEFVLSFQLDSLPQNDGVADGDPSSTATMHESLLTLFPVVPPEVHENVQAIFARGQRLGNQPFVATKIGDSVVANEWYLLPMAWRRVNLGPYAYMEPTLELFGPGMSESVAARQGLTSATAFDAFWADKSLCQPNESPLACEYRIKRPSVAFIMFGYNDMIAMSATDFRTHMRRLVEESVLAGVIPVLITFSSNPETSNWADSLEYNVAIIDTSTRYRVPMINLWLASRSLPDYGLERDNIHLRNSGYDHLTYAEGQEADSGVALLNLLSLRVLHDLRIALNLQV